jgi:hypothetical protein
MVHRIGIVRLGGTAELAPAGAPAGAAAAAAAAQPPLTLLFAVALHVSQYGPRSNLHIYHLVLN